MKMVFRETQRFHQAWIWIFLLGLDTLFFYAIISQIFNGVPFGSNPAPDYLLILFALIPLSLTFMFTFMRLETSVDDRGIRFRFFPFHLKERAIDWNEITQWTLRTYHPLADFGGYGIQRGSSLRTFTIAGKQGLQLDLKNGKRILIGTQDREALEDMLRNLPRE